MRKKILTAFTSIILLIGCVSIPQQGYDDADVWKTKVETYHLQTYFPAEYQTAVEKYTAAKGYFKKDNGKSKINFDQAITLFKKIYEEGMALLCKDKNSENNDIIARINSKDGAASSLNEYKAAVNDINTADSASANNLFEDALVNYTKAGNRLDLLMAALSAKIEAENWKIKIDEESLPASDEYNNAAAVLIDAGRNYDTDNAKAKELFTNASAAFEKFYNSEMPLLWITRMNQLKTLLDSLAVRGSDIPLLNEYTSAGVEYKEIEGMIETKQYSGLPVRADNIEKRLRLLEDVLNAKDEAGKWREDLEQYDLVKTFEPEYKAADEKYKQALSQYDRDNQSAVSLFKDSSILFQQIYNKGFSFVAGVKIDDLDKSIAALKGLKLTDAEKQEYDKAINELAAAKIKSNENEYGGTMDAVNNAEKIIETINASIKARKEATTNLINEAKTKIMNLEAKINNSDLETE